MKTATSVMATRHTTNIRNHGHVISLDAEKTIA
jgi:hypothetical protein